MDAAVGLGSLASTIFRQASRGDIRLRSVIIAMLAALHLDGAARAAHGRAVRALSTSRAALSSATATLTAVRAWVGSWPDRSRTTRGYRRFLSRGVRLEVLSGDVSSSSIPLVMCMWRRPERMATILAMLDGQRDCPPIRLVLWNNEPANSAHLRSTIEQFSGEGSLESVELYDSAVNVGGVGRFLAIRELLRQGIGPEVIMIDDDQDVTPMFVRDLAAVAAPHAISGIWAWRIHSGYWDRTQVVTHGDSADYVGTGGCVCDPALFLDEGFLPGLPSKFLFMEDIWMSRYAASHGWKLRMVDSPVSFVLAELDQGHALHRQKEQFYNWTLSRS